MLESCIHPLLFTCVRVQCDVSQSQSRSLPSILNTTINKRKYTTYFRSSPVDADFFPFPSPYAFNFSSSSFSFRSPKNDVCFSSKEFMPSCLRVCVSRYRYFMSSKVHTIHRKTPSSHAPRQQTHSVSSRHAILHTHKRHGSGVVASHLNEDVASRTRCCKIWWSRPGRESDE